ncbi:MULTISPECIES: glycoside hydrolase family 13 protein [unclassified Streptomyces]|uniref:glycoside hydrolase family 13 protein n=1 Tax=unclassified Streptomyces TaxID=2593676 RepID=UPI002252A4D0|nr:MULTISPECIES: glycoside hydrolase family 13 protein [unclassified Streptomyces]MCX5047692.1 glycoside hydrolase family 13 protein [Streptomyces sp. NBC_00474]MCX5057620.1 glycoside hydrolase family 13 protein [Streptomyces sp. NBC_00452]MCX5245503.1 glycoside hydrolase family 13 protein [Streptomyces sp. NBC_00201]
MSQQHSVIAPALTPAKARRSDWWRDAVIYQVYPRSFADSNGDGMGDLEGVRSRLPYLRDLGVDAVWLSPFYASPQADAGYDVADYRAVDPMFGSLLDADALIRDAHELALRIIVDLVPNHSSDQHEWFKRALREGPGSPLRDRYHFRPGKGASGELPPNDWESIFGGPAWTRVTEPDGTPGQWYLHLFAPEQPDFNWEHPAVGDEFRSILRFWLDIGVDGFRIDVAHGLVKAEGLPDLGSHEQLKLLGNDVMPFFDQDGVHEIYRQWRLILDEYSGNQEGPEGPSSEGRGRETGGRIFVAEAWTPTIERTANYVRPDELHQAFNFQYLSTDWDAAELREVVDRTLDAMRPVGAPATWVLSNHDVTRHATRFANPPGLGTQIRTAGDRELGLRRARAATLLLLALPGSAYVYQGEELGLPDVVDLADEVRQDPAYFRGAGQDGFRDGCRVPIPWTREGSSYGFGSGGSWLPQPESWGELSVEAQDGVPGSTLELYRSAFAARREQPDLGAGDAVEWLRAPEGVLAFRRGDFVCVTNTGGESVTTPAYGRVLLTSGEVTEADGEAKVPADTTVWFTTCP